MEPDPMDLASRPRSSSLFNPLDMQPEDVEQFAATLPAELESEEGADMQAPQRPAPARPPHAPARLPSSGPRARPNAPPRAQRAPLGGGGDLVGKEVWDLLAVEGLSEGVPAARSSQSGAPAQLANLGSLGGYKRSRVAASLSSVGSDDMRMLATATEELAKEFNSMELKHLFKSGRGGLGASGDVAACLAAAAASQPLSGTGLGLDMEKPKGAGSLDSAMVGASITSDDMNILLHAGASPLLNADSAASAELLDECPGPSSLDAAAAAPSLPFNLGEDVGAPGIFGPPRSQEGSVGKLRGRARSSSDNQRPLWRSVLQSMDTLSAKLLIEGHDIQQKQSAIWNFYEMIVPNLKALGPVGTLAHQRLTVMMADTGLVQGTMPPETAEDFADVVEQALAAVKRYASSAMLASAVAPRGTSPSSSRAGGSATPARDEASLGEASFGADISDSGRTSALDGDSHKLHACRNCQKAKTACTDQRPCARCLRLQVPCDDDHRSVKRACSNCKKAKVKCNLADAIPCARCKRLGLDCTPHVPNKKKRLSTEDSFDISPELSASSFADPMGLNLGPLVAQPQFGAHLGAGLKDDVTDPFGPVEDVCALFMQDCSDEAASSASLAQQQPPAQQQLPPEQAESAAQMPGLFPAGATSPAADSAPGLAQSLPCPPLLTVQEVLSVGSWTTVHQEGNLSVHTRARGERVLWLTRTTMPVPPATAAAGLRQLFRNWGTDDQLVQNVSVLSEGGGVPAWVSTCALCFEQILHAKCAPVSLLHRMFEPRDFVLRSVWTLYQGLHVCCIRPTTEAAAAETPGVKRSAVSIDVWVLPSQVEPNGSNWYAVIDPGEFNASLIAYNYKKLFHWTRRVQEAAMLFHRERAEGDPL